MPALPAFHGSLETELMLHATPHHPTVLAQVLKAERQVVEEFSGPVRSASGHWVGHRPGHHANGTMRLTFDLASGKRISLGLYVHPIAPAEPIMFEDLSGYIRWIGHRRLLELTPSDH